MFSVPYLPSEISSWGVGSSHEIDNQLLSKVYNQMSHLFRPLGRDMEYLDQVFWELHGQDTAISLQAFTTHVLSNLYSTNEEHFRADITYCPVVCGTPET